MELADIKDSLSEPFDVELVRFKPGSKLPNDTGRCFPLAFVSWTEYVKRLNEVAYGFYQVPKPDVYVTQNKIEVVQPLFVCGVEVVGVGESFVAEKTDNDICEAFDQAWKRACSIIGLGLYLYEAKLGPVPFDGKKIIPHDLVLASDWYLSQGYYVPDSVLDKLEELRTKRQDVITNQPEYGTNFPKENSTESDKKKQKIDQLSKYNNLSRVFLEQLSVQQLGEMQRRFMNKEDRDSILTDFDYKEPATTSSYRRPWKSGN